MSYKTTQVEHITPSIMHFDRTSEMNICTKFLLSYVDGGFSWLKNSIKIDTMIIS